MKSKTLRQNILNSTPFALPVKFPPLNPNRTPRTLTPHSSDPPLQTLKVLLHATSRRARRFAKHQLRCQPPRTRHIPLPRHIGTDARMEML
jgi:hypothetical protein